MLVVGAAVVGIAAGVAFAAFMASDPGSAPATAGEPVVAPGASPTVPAGDPAVPVEDQPFEGLTELATPVSTVDVIGTASSGRGGMAKTLFLRQLGRWLAAAHADGGSPVAVVRSRTELRAAPGGRVMERLGTETEFGSPRVHAVAGRKHEWLEVRAAELPNGETGWINALAVDIEAIDHSLHASLEDRTLTVRLNGRVVRRVDVAIGAPGTSTPTGAFAVSDKLRMRDEGSTYGCCVLAFTGHQPRIPQGWSGGDRLAVHATLDEALIGQPVSLGCLRADDADMRWLIRRVPLGTPVTISR